MTDDGFTVCITVAASHVGRSIKTLRRWTERGEVAGLPLDCHRDPVSNVRHYRRRQIEDIRAALRGISRARSRR